MQHGDIYNYSSIKILQSNKFLSTVDTSCDIFTLDVSDFFGLNIF